MAVLKREDFLNSIKTRIGEDISDEAMQFIEDMSDTYDDLASKTNDKEDWKSKYEENDKMWKEKYKARFFNSEGTEDKDMLEPSKSEIDPSEEIEIDDLFTESEV